MTSEDRSDAAWPPRSPEGDEACPICGSGLDDGSGTEHECPPGFRDQATTFSRQQILDAFGVAEDDLVALEAATGWNAAREAAEREREEFVAETRKRASEISSALAEKFGAEVRWDDAEA